MNAWPCVVSQCEEAHCRAEWWGLHGDVTYLVQVAAESDYSSPAVGPPVQVSCLSPAQGIFCIFFNESFLSVLFSPGSHCTACFPLLRLRMRAPHSTTSRTLAYRVPILQDEDVVSGDMSWKYKRCQWGIHPVQWCVSRHLTVRLM